MLKVKIKNIGRKDRSYRMDFARNRFEAAKRHYEKLDCVDSYIELLILINCCFIDKFRPCRHHLKYVIDLLIEKWDDIRFIKFEDALELAKYLKTFVPSLVVLDHYQINRKLLKKMIAKARIEKKTLDALLENKPFSLQGIGKNLYARTFIYNMLASNKDMYGVYDFKDDLVFI